MRTRLALPFLLFFWMIPVVTSSAAGAETHDSMRFSLHGTWRMQSSCAEQSAPEAISTVSFADSAWHKAEVPGTVVGALVADGPPPADIETLYLGILKDLGWPNPTVSSAAADSTTVTGKSGVKMTGPYEYVPPMYWLVDTTAGGAYGYNTETSPGPAIPPMESLRRFIPEEHLWPIDEYWNYHAGGGRFTTVNVFTEGLNRRYGQAASLDDYSTKTHWAHSWNGVRKDLPSVCASGGAGC